METQCSQTASVTRVKKVYIVCLNFIDSIQSYLVEAAYFMFFLSWHMSLPLFQEYVSIEVNRRHMSSKVSDIGNSPVNETELFHQAQKESTMVILSLQIAEGLPAVITVIILGALSDRTGRRRIMLWLPSLGSCVYSIIYILILLTGWSLDGLFMASALRGLSGSMTAFLAGGSYYAINIVKPHQRSSRLALQELLNGAAYAVGYIMVGFWVQASGFLQPFLFCFACSVISLLISFFLVKELTVSENRSPRRNITGNCFTDTFSPLAKFLHCRNNIKLVRVWLAILAFQTYSFVHLGQINTLVLYFHWPPLSWTATKLGVFLSVAMACAALSTGIVPPFLRTYMNETQIAFAGFFSKAIGTLWIAVVHNETVIYFGILLLVLELLPFPMMRSIVAKGIDPEQQGSLFALMHFGESISYFLAPLVFQSIFANTLHYYTGFVFVVSVILLVLPFGFTLGIRYIDLREAEGEQNENTEGEHELIHNEILPDGADASGQQESMPGNIPTSISTDRV